MKFAKSLQLSDFNTEAMTQGTRNRNAKETYKLKKEEYDEQKKVQEDFRSQRDKAIDDDTLAFFAGRLVVVERKLSKLKKEMEECLKEVHESEYQKCKARAGIMLENNGTQKCADMIMEDEFAKMEAEFALIASKKNES